MADISTSNKVLPASYSNFSAFSNVKTYRWEPVVDGTSATGTHNILPIGLGEALVSVICYVNTAFASGGSATITFQVGSDQLSGVIPVANLSAGKIFNLGAMLGTGVAQTQDTLTDSSGGTADTTLAVLPTETGSDPAAMAAQTGAVLGDLVATSGGWGADSEANFDAIATDYDKTIADVAAAKTAIDANNTAIDANIADIIALGEWTADGLADIAAQLAKIKTDVSTLIPTTGYAGYAVSAADTLDVAVGTAALTAGKLYITACYLDVTAFSSHPNG
jgi:hypothetical protein